jgi:hypothetical protein
MTRACVGFSKVFKQYVRLCWAAKVWLPLRCFNSHDVTSILSSLMGGAYGKNMLDFVPVAVFFFSFFLLSYWVIENNSLIYFSSWFDLYSFYLYLFYFSLSIKLNFFFNLIILWFFHFLDLVPILLILIFLITLLIKLSF